MNDEFDSRMEMLGMIALIVVVGIFWSLIWPVTACMIGYGQFKEWRMG